MTFTVVADPNTASVRLDADVAGASVLQVARSWGDVVNEPVRVADPWHGGSMAAVRDLECPFDVPVTYTLWAFDDNGVQVGTTATAGPVTLQGSRGDWLRPITRPVDGVNLWVESYPALERDGRVALLDVLNRADRIAVTAPRGLPTGVLTVVTMTDRERKRMLAMIATGEPLVFLSPPELGVGRQYLAVDKVSEQRISRLAQEQSRRWVMQVAEVGYPAGTTTQTGFNTWGDVRTNHANWQAVKDAGTWGDIAGAIPSPPPSPGDRSADSPVGF